MPFAVNLMHLSDDFECRVPMGDVTESSHTRCKIA